MAVVVDASAIAAIMFAELEGPTLAAHIDGDTLLAPVLLDFELANVARTKMRRSPALGPQILMALNAALALPVSRIRVPLVEVFALAAETGLTAYDASYLWLARSRDVELVTLDAALMRLAR
jgi:predicted nucleic acid-binding protein